MSNCPQWQWVESALQDSASTMDSRRAQTHLGDCSSCREFQLQHELLAGFSRLRRRTLPAEEWAAVWRAVRAEAGLQAESATPWHATWLRWLAPVTLAASLCLTPALSLWRGAPALTAVASRDGAADEPYGEYGARSTNDAVEREDVADGRGFAYLSNPRAVIAHVLVADDQFDAAIPLTMVIDERLADLF